MSHELIDFVVGGVTYPIHKRDIEKYPESFLSAAVKKEWHDGKTPVVVDRDGELFQHIHAYLVSGFLSKAAKLSKDKALLDSIRQEAEFFGFPELAEECALDEVVAPLNNYKTIRSFIKTAPRGSLPVDFPKTSMTPLIVALGSLWAPFCVAGLIGSRSYTDHKLFQSTTICEVNVAELLAAATPSSFGRGTETVLDPTVRNSLEIPADKLDPAGLRSIERQILRTEESLSPNNPIELKPYKLVIYQQGGHFDQHRDTVRGKGHIGTVVVILNSAYSGGELEITHGGRTEVVTGPYHWVAMYGDCLHKINPVTSGTRVSLIYDIYTTSPAPQHDGADEPAAKRTRTDSQGGSDSDKQDSEEDEDEDEDEDVNEEDAEFWSGDSNPLKFYEAKARGADAPAIHKALNKELRKLDSVVICLQHMYPACQAVPGFLKGADAVLYEVLQDHYEVQVVHCSIHYQNGYSRYDGMQVCASLFSSFEDNDGPSENTKLVIPTQLDSDRILDYTPHIEYTGNESQAEETVYVVTGLQVRRRE
jgi:predicted 2-oxoglutarate/Fe(II)-dependent dioxygenase YbiX